MYSLATRRHTRLTSFGGSPIWLKDSRRLLFVQDDKVLMVDAATRQVHTVATLAPREVGKLTISADNRLLYVGVTSTDADIWVRSTR